MEDFRLVEAKTAWNVQAWAAEFTIRVQATDADLQGRVSVGLHVRFPKTYPRVAPVLSVEDAVGLSAAQSAMALGAAQRAATELLGGEMVYELVISVAEQITKDNSAAVAAKPSFHAQMEERRREESVAIEERAMAERRMREAAAAEEQMALQRRIREELARKQQEAQSVEEQRRHLGEVSAAVQSVAGRWAAGIRLLRFDQAVELVPAGARFHTVALEESAERDELCAVFDAYPTDLSGGDVHLADRFTVQCFAVTAPHYLTDQGRRQVDVIGGRISKLTHIRHRNLVAVHACRIEVLGGGRGLALWVMSDAVAGSGASSLEDLLDACGSVGVAQTRTYLRQILLALVSLHAAGFVHRSVMPRNILVVREARGRHSAKLFNTSYREELLALHRATPLSAAIGARVGSDIRVAPEVVDRPDIMGRKNDVWCVGVVGLQMALGTDCLHGVEIGREPEVLRARRSEIPPVLFEALELLLTMDQRQRPTAMEALNCPFFHAGLEGQASVHRQALDSASRGLTFELQRKDEAAVREPAAKPPPMPAISRRPLQQPQQPVEERLLRPAASRYRTDFEEVEFLGKGGFGSVVKARNVIDGRFYAIKKIRLDARDTESKRKIFREVTTLSRLHHQNVVRYYTTWIEDAPELMGGIAEEDEEDSDSVFGLASHSEWSTEDESGMSDSSSSSSSTDSDDMLAQSGPRRGDAETTGSDELGSKNRVFSAIRFGTMGRAAAAAQDTRAIMPRQPQQKQQQQSVREFRIEFTDSPEQSMYSDSHEQSESGEFGAVSSSRQTEAELSEFLLQQQQQHTERLKPRPRRKKPAPRKNQILYIQMEYCENKTLSDLIREGLSEKEAWRLFQQILEGLQHIHQCGVIHRDLKPVNAFLDAAGDIKIGDFGLATSSFAQIDSAGVLRNISIDRSLEDALTADVGTSTYVAPEVMSQTSSGARYNQKVDMYSLGIMFFEMCYPMRTGMERAAVLRNLRTAEIVFPKDFAQEKLPLQYQIIRRLLTHSPRARPSSAELLESDLLPPKMEDEHIQETIRTIANPSQPYFARLMDSLFAASRRVDTKHVDATFDFRAGDGQAEQLNAVFLDGIRELMTRVFRTHAAVELTAPALVPRAADLLATADRPAQFVDPRGAVVQLPYDQAVPFARYVARTRMTEIKRYCFDRCFEANPAGGQPLSHSVASFDAVTNRSAHAVAAAEVVSVACEVFNALPAFRARPTVLLLNHMNVLDAVLAYCGILHPEWAADPRRTEPAAEDSDDRHAQFVRSLCHCLGSLYRERAVDVRQRIQLMAITMGVRLPAQALDRLQQFMAIPEGDLGAVQREVLARIGSECGMAGSIYAGRGAEHVHQAVRGFGELRYVEATVRHFGVAVPMRFHPLFNHHYAYYEGGYAFQIMAEPARARQPPQVLALGGRNDGLLRRFRHLAGSHSGEPADATPRISSSFARRAGSLHSTDVWQQMFEGPSSLSRPGSPSANGAPVSIGTQLSQGSAALGTARDVVSIGVQIQLDFIVQEMARYQQRVLTTAPVDNPVTFGLWTRKRCDVVVASFGTRPMLRERISLARSLWANGLRADFLFNDDPEMTMERLVEICRDQGMNWIVTLKRRPSAESRGTSELSGERYVFKVKNILRRVECEVQREALCAWLHADITEQYKLDLLTHEHRGALPPASSVPAPPPSVAVPTRSELEPTNRPSSSAGAGRVELTLVSPQAPKKNLNRSRHKQKMMLTDRALSSVTRIIGEVKGAPVLVFDLGPELLRRLGGEPSILSDSGFKRLMELCSAHQRAYLVELKSYLERYHREGCSYVWLYSTKGDCAITYKV
ncbi:eukaryotic translation initiation factor 2-alpha kinase [Coemansia sp. RSA 552]|nr:eukaryotic translation initiation factor 2-alpha kinase [Coemansia sp. RSA 552]